MNTSSRIRSIKRSSLRSISILSAIIACGLIIPTSSAEAQTSPTVSPKALLKTPMNPPSILWETRGAFDDQDDFHYIQSTKKDLDGDGTHDFIVSNTAAVSAGPMESVQIYSTRRGNKLASAEFTSSGTYGLTIIDDRVAVATSIPGADGVINVFEISGRRQLTPICQYVYPDSSRGQLIAIEKKFVVATGSGDDAPLIAAAIDVDCKEIWYNTQSYSGNTQNLHVTNDVDDDDHDDLALTTSTQGTYIISGATGALIQKKAGKKADISLSRSGDEENSTSKIIRSYLVNGNPDPILQAFAVEGNTGWTYQVDSCHRVVRLSEIVSLKGDNVNDVATTQMDLCSRNFESRIVVISGKDGTDLWRSSGELPDPLPMVIEITDQNGNGKSDLAVAFADVNNFMTIDGTTGDILSDDPLAVGQIYAMESTTSDGDTFVLVGGQDKLVLIKY